ncbi:unnamed protein product, partial [Rotaria sp. Silwood2]
RFHENVTDRAKNTKETTDIVLSQCTSKLPDSAHIRLPPLDHIKRTIQQHRKKNDLPQIVNDVDFSSVPVVLQSTKRNDTFLRIDTDSGNSPEQTVILEFSTDFLMNGAFDIVPAIFYQLFVIHAVHREHVIPVAFCLLRQKNTTTYQEMVNKILEFAPAWNHRTIMLDFEKTVLNVLSNSFAQVSLSDYFEDNYIVRFRANGSRTRPLFTIEYWNAHERTNNSAEAWNRCIKCIFQCSHPTL